MFQVSAHSPTWQSFAGGDAEIGLHGTSDPVSVGHAVSHGCIRVDNATITRLAAVLPVGTPIDVHA